MKPSWMIGVLAGALALLPAAAGRAAEHGGTSTAGKEHGGTTAPAAKEHGGTAQPEPSAEQIRQTIRDHIAKTTPFTIQDPVTGTRRTLTLIGVHDRVGKTGQYYYSCTDMKDTASGETLDLDFDVEASGGQSRVVDTRIHKVNGKPRYTYDDKDNRIPVTP